MTDILKYSMFQNMYNITHSEKALSVSPTSHKYLKRVPGRQDVLSV